MFELLKGRFRIEGRPRQASHQPRGHRHSGVHARRHPRSVKALDPRELREMGTQILLGNTLSPEHSAWHGNHPARWRVAPIHHWPHPILTTAEVSRCSASPNRKINTAWGGVRSHLDGSLLFLGPRKHASPRELGSDIAMVFDECPPHTATPGATKEAVERTLRWAAECREQPRAAGQCVFGIVQGGAHAALRENVRRELVAMKFDGYAIGGRGECG